MVVTVDMSKTGLLRSHIHQKFQNKTPQNVLLWRASVTTTANCLMSGPWQVNISTKQFPKVHNTIFLTLTFHSVMR